MKNYLLAFAVIICFIISSCSSAWIAPPYTDTEKIIDLKTSMSMSSVTNKLGIPPFDVYHLQEDGSSVLVFNYRLRNRKMSYGSDTQLHNEESQSKGKLWYSDDSYLLYVLFKDSKMVSLVTEAGRKDSEAILITNNTIQLLSKDEMDVYELAKLRYFLGQNSPNPDEMIVPIFKKKRK